MATISEKIEFEITGDATAWALTAMAMEPATPGAGVEQVSIGTWKSRSANTNSLSFSWTMSTGDSNTAIIVSVVNDGGSAPTGVTYGGVSLTKIIEKTQGDINESLWVLVAPADGANTLVASFSTTVNVILHAGGYKAVHQTTPTAGTVTTSGTANADTFITITSGTLAGGLLIIGIGARPATSNSDVTSGELEISTFSGPRDLRNETSSQLMSVPPPRPPKFDEPSGGGGPIGEPGIGIARKPRRDIVRRGLRGRRGVPQPIGTRGEPQVLGDPIDKRIPDEYEEPLVRKWLTFGWLTIPMLEGQKTITLRDWGPTEGVQWQHGELFYAYDTPPVEDGRRLAILRVMQEPFVEFTAKLRMADYHKLGFSYAMANQLLTPSGRTALQVWEDLHNKPESLWLMRFVVERIFEQGRKERGTVQIAEMPRRV
jgi:hypothetical protein